MMDTPLRLDERRRTDSEAGADAPASRGSQYSTASDRATPGG